MCTGGGYDRHLAEGLYQSHPSAEERLFQVSRVGTLIEESQLAHVLRLENP